MAARKISELEGLAALQAWKTSSTNRETTRTAARYALEVLTERYPGRTVEVRIPGAGAVQILSGPKHRRGTPPSVVEIDIETWLCLVAGRVEWEQACVMGRISATGERSNLKDMFPLW